MAVRPHHRNHILNTCIYANEDLDFRLTLTRDSLIVFLEIKLNLVQVQQA